MTESDSKTHLAFQLRSFKKRTNLFGTYKNDIRKRLETKQNIRDSSHQINIHKNHTEYAKFLMFFMNYKCDAN